jgi:hypothetical protein
MTYQIVLGASSLSITADPVLNNIATVIPYDVISLVHGAFSQKPVTAQDGEWIYKYDTITELIIEKNDGGAPLRVELQEVSNQATWDGGTLTDLQTAIAAIQALI